MKTPMPSKALYYEKSIYLPLSVIANSMGYRVSWNQEKETDCTPGNLIKRGEKSESKHKSKMDCRPNRYSLLGLYDKSTGSAHFNLIQRRMPIRLATEITDSMSKREKELVQLDWSGFSVQENNGEERTVNDRTSRRTR